VENTEELLLRNTYLNSLKQKTEVRTIAKSKGKKIKWADEEKKTLATIIVRANEKTPEHRTEPTDFIEELEKLSKLSAKKSTPIKSKVQSSYATKLNRDITSMTGQKKIGFSYDEYLKGSPYKKVQKSQSVNLYLIL
jgi:hypothetical protein